MPSPIAHSVAGYVIYRLWGRPSEPRRPVASTAGSGSAAQQRWPGLHRLATIATLAALSLLPDADVVAALIFGDMAGFHNQGWHSLLVGCAVAPCVGLLIGGRRGFRRWTLLAWLCFEIHVLMDGFSVGRGVMWFWPLSTERFHPPFYFFHGVRWAEGWWAWDHLWTLLNELGWVALVIMLVRFRAPKH